MSNAKTIVIDFGRRYIRYGIGGEYYPREIAENNLTEVMSESVAPNLGRVIEFFHNMFITLCVKPKEYRVLLVENLFLRKHTRDILMSILMREFQVSVTNIFALLVVCSFPPAFLVHVVAYMIIIH